MIATRWVLHQVGLISKGCNCGLHIGIVVVVIVVWWRWVHGESQLQLNVWRHISLVDEAMVFDMILITKYDCNRWIYHFWMPKLTTIMNLFEQLYQHIEWRNPPYHDERKGEGSNTLKIGISWDWSISIGSYTMSMSSSGTLRHQSPPPLRLPLKLCDSFVGMSWQHYMDCKYLSIYFCCEALISRRPHWKTLRRQQWPPKSLSMGHVRKCCPPFVWPFTD